MVNGIIIGYNLLINQLIMGQVIFKVKIKKGILVMIFGLGGIMLKGFYVGKVVKIGMDDYGLV